MTLGAKDLLCCVALCPLGLRYVTTIKPIFYAWIMNNFKALLLALYWGIPLTVVCTCKPASYVGFCLPGCLSLEWWRPKQISKWASNIPWMSAQRCTSPLTTVCIDSVLRRPLIHIVNGKRTNSIWNTRYVWPNLIGTMDHAYNLYCFLVSKKYQ